MDWELYERYRSTLLLAGLLLVSSLLLAFQKTSSVQHLRSFLVRFALPPQQFLSQAKALPTISETASLPAVEENAVPAVAEYKESYSGEARRQVQVLNEENARLREILELQRQKWPRAVVAHVAGRDPQRWFQEIVLDKGKEDGLEIDNPVLAVIEGREALLGRVVEVSGH